ncbi:hypothetical protein GPB2148_1634 [marine gamma proteobacterium HTCC2148]|nr:hypothetical protein GPB2148_1634 [marine gamma proteobacterium HTCC2148]
MTFVAIFEARYLTINSGDKRNGKGKEENYCEEGAGFTQKVAC